jgi:hypothetical protein
MNTLTTPDLRSQHPATTIGFRGWVDKYFYFAMSLLIAAIVIWGFSHTIDANLFHGAPPRPLLLWIHGAAFSLWVAFYILCAVRRHGLSVGANPTRQLSFQPVAIGAAVEATKRLEPSV